MDKATLRQIVDARNSRLGLAPGPERLNLRLNDERVFRVERGTPWQAEDCILLRGQCDGLPFTILMTAAILNDIPEEYDDGAMLLMHLLEQGRAEILAIEQAMGGPIVFDHLDVEPALPDPDDLCLALGAEQATLALRCDAALRDRLETALADGIERVEDWPEPDTVFTCTVFRGILEYTGEPLEPGMVLLLAQAPPAPFILIEEEIALAVSTQGPAPVIEGIDTAAAYFEARGAGAADILIIAEREDQTFEALEALSNGDAAPFSSLASTENLILFRNGIPLALARLVTTGKDGNTALMIGKLISNRLNR